MTAVRLLLGAAGVVLGLYGLLELATTVPVADYWPVLRWGVAGVVVHDALLAPAEVVLGWVLLRRTSPGRSGVLRAGLLGLICLLLVTAVTVGARMSRQNPTALPTDPLVGLGVGLLGLVATMAVLLVRTRRTGGAQPSGAPLRPPAG